MRSALYSVLFAANFVGAAHGNLVENGSFELSILDPGTGFIALGGGSAVIDDWVVVGNGVDYIGDIWAASEGERSLDLNNLSAGGGVEQSFATVIGEVYLVEFDLSANMFGLPAQKLMRVSAGGSAAQFMFDYVAQGATPVDPMWASMSWSFTAQGTTSTLRFSGVSDGTAGAALDNVNVSVLPSPGGVAVLGILGLGWARRRR